MTNDVTVTVSAASPTASCPWCGTSSKRVQSRYTRMLRDLPASGRPVRLIVRVRRFFCHERTCVRKIFAERFPALTLPRRKFTLRLQETLREMDFALGGEAGARLGKHLSIPGSPDTLLRLVKGTQLPAGSSPRVVGIDEWSWKRRLRYGTLICDLESSGPIDVLPDRSVETISAWFESHPTVEIVSRDRSSEYAAAIRKGAPQALQVADRWHISKNLADSVQALLARCRADIRRGLHVQAPPEQEREETEPVPEAERRTPRSHSVELARAGRRAQKLDRYTYLATLRTPQSPPFTSSPAQPSERKSLPSSPAPLENFSAQRATWLFVCQPEQLDARHQAELVLIRQASPSVETAYRLAQAFMQMIREQTGHQLDTWLGEVEASHLPEFESFARGIQQDKAAVLADLTLPWSQGPLEGHVNRLKLIKRSMYGRAKLPLLRARVLQVAEKQPARAATLTAG